MKRIFYPLLVAAVALSLLLPAIIFAAQNTGPVCSMHPGKASFAKDGDYYCAWTENVPQNKLTRSGRAGQLQWVYVRTAQRQTHKCAPWEHSE